MKRLGAILLTIPLAGAGLVAAPKLSAEAGSDPQCYEGTPVSGAIPFGDSPLILEKQQITMKIGALPAVGEGGSVSGQGASVMQCAYTLSNPTEEAASVELLLPCTPPPLYAAEVAARYEVISEEADPSVRHSYMGYFNRSSDLEAGIRQLYGDGADDFYGREGLTVTEYRFTVNLSESALAGVNRKYVSFVLTFDCNPVLSRVISRRMYTEVVNGKIQASYDVGTGESEILLTVVGEDISDLSYGLYVDRTREKKLEIGSLSYDTEKTPFSEYALRSRPQDSEISEEDWRDGFVYMLKKSTANDSVVYAFPELIREESFLKWYDYELTVPAKGKAVHTVESPLFPTVEGGRYEYSLLLRPQLLWKRGGIDIAIETPYVLASSNLDFKKTDMGYAFSRMSLPVSDLRFVLVESEDALNASSSAGLSPSLRLAVILLGSLGGAAVLGGGVAAAVLLSKRRKKQ